MLNNVIIQKKISRLSGNKFEYLPNSIYELKNLTTMYVIYKYIIKKEKTIIYILN